MLEAARSHEQASKVTSLFEPEGLLRLSSRMLPMQLREKVVLFNISYHVWRVKYRTKAVFFTMFILQANDSPGILQTFLEGLYSNYKERIAVLKTQVRVIKMSRLNIGLCLCGSLDYSSSKLSSSQSKKTVFEMEGSNCISHLECREEKNSLFLGLLATVLKVGSPKLNSTN